VGRLDKETSGLLLFTNDHQLANFLTSPESSYRKTYIAVVDRQVGREDLLLLSRGVDIEIKGSTYRTKPAEISQPISAKLEISITEGKNRQIRRMLDALGYEVVSLQRIAVGPLKLGDLPEAGTRDLSGDEVQELKKAIRPKRSEARKPRTGKWKK
jgi:pseudouridine synthase